MEDPPGSDDASGLGQRLQNSQGVDVSDIPAVLLILRSVSGAVSGTLSTTAEEPRKSKEVHGPEEPIVPSAPITLSSSCSSQLMSGTGGCYLETPPPTDYLLLCMVC